MSACVPSLDRAAYLDRMVAGGTKLSQSLLTSLHAALHEMHFRAAYLPASFLHFGARAAHSLRGLAAASAATGGGVAAAG